MGESRLTSIVYCDAAVWRRSLSCYLWTPFWLLLIGKLQSERKTHFVVYLRLQHTGSCTDCFPLESRYSKM